MEKWEDILEHMQRIHRRTRRKLTQSEKVAVDTYHNLHSPNDPGMGLTMNEFVRGLPSVRVDRQMHDVLRRLVANLDAAFQKAPHLPLPPSSHPPSLSNVDLYRGLSGSIAKRLRQTWTRAGSTRRSDGFISTSFVPLSALHYTRNAEEGIILHIR